MAAQRIFGTHRSTSLTRFCFIDRLTHYLGANFYFTSRWSELAPAPGPFLLAVGSTPRQTGSIGCGLSFHYCSDNRDQMGCEMLISVFAAILRQPILNYGTG